MTEETPKATIQVRKVKKGDQAFISVPTKRGSQEMTLSERLLSAELAELLRKSPAALQGKEVEYALANGQIQGVWEAGKPRTAPPQPPAGQAPRAGAGGAPAGPGRSGSQRPGPGGGPNRGRGPGGGFQDRGQRPVDQGGNHGGQSLNTGRQFENPYNFIPAPPRDRGHASLGDQVPRGHHRWHQDLWSGRISVELTTVTPLLIPDLGRDNGQGHRTFGLRLDEHGAPYLPPTSLKGALRVPYEAITGSRMGIFAGHEERLALRMPAPEALKLVPCRVVLGPGGALMARLMPGHSAIGPGGKPQGAGADCEMYAAWLPRYRGYGKNSRSALDKHEASDAMRYPGGGIPNHREEVWVQTTVRPHRTGRFSYRAVTAIQPAPAGATCPLGWEKGYVYVSGPNIMNKHDERVFLETPAMRDLPISPDQVRAWTRLVSDYRDVHTKELDARRQAGQQPQHYLGHEPGRTGFSRHVFGPGAEHLGEGDLCYARIETDSTGRPQTLLELYPVTITRMLYRHAPKDRLDPTLWPADDLTHLSPADRVFGWVNRNGKGSHKGQLRIGAVTCLDGAAAVEQVGGNDGVVLAILGQPKPAQARFYAARTPKGEPLARGTDKKDAYDTGGGLRGRKVYPQQGQAELPGYWDATTQAAQRLEVSWKGREVYREWQRHDRERDDQNRSVTAWVRPGTRFRFDLDVTNLSEQELGALLWLLTLKQGMHLRLGGGKPLGFGSVHIQATQLSLSTGKALAADYRSFGKAPDSAGQCIRRLEESQGPIMAYQAALPAALGEPGTAFAQLAAIRAFQNATQAGTLPVHYPRTAEQGRPSGESFQWFVQNEKRDRNRDERHSLPALYEPSHGLPELQET